MSEVPAGTTDASSIRHDLLAALGRSGSQLVAQLDSIGDPRRRIPAMAWNVGDLGAHLVTNLSELTLALGGRPCAYDGAFEAGKTGDVDDMLVEQYTERDLQKLADDLRSALTEFSDAASVREPDDRVGSISPYATVNSIAAMFVLDQNNHGSQLQSSGASDWDLPLADVRLGLVTLIPATLDRQAIERFKGKFSVHLRGTTEIDLTVDHGKLTVDVPQHRVDSHIVSDPIAFLRVNTGAFMTQRRAVLTGKIFAYGRRPWKLFGLFHLMRPLQHGGKARKLF